MTTAADAIALELKSLGIRHFFLVTGGDNSLWIALRHQGIQQVLARSEASAVYMADGYARVTGLPTFVYGQYGPGAANLAGALPEPMWSSSPVVAMPTTTRRQHRPGGEYQELEQRRVFSGVTKWQAEAQLPEQMAQLVRAGAMRAVATPPGPVYIGMPSDALELDVPITEADAANWQTMRVPVQRPRPSTALVRASLRLLGAAKKPVLLAGNGVHLSGAYAALANVVDSLGVPVATSLSGKGAIADTHRLAIGTVGRYSRNYANAILRDADLVIAIGSRLGSLVTDGDRLFGAATRIVQVDPDPSAASTNLSSLLFIQADAAAFLEDLAAELDANRDQPDYEPWVSRVCEDRRAWQARFANIAASEGPGGSMRPESVMRAINDLAPIDTILVADTGYAAAWAGALVESKRPGHHFLRADGSLGWAFPAALGVQLAAPASTVIVVVGDGGFGYHIGDIETALRLDLRVVVVILNNRSLAFEAHVQSLLYDEVVEEVDDFLDVDYAAVSRAFGANGGRVHTAVEFREAFAIGLERKRLTIIDAIIDRDAIGPVTRYETVRAREL
jgi:acetolactate synthase-1/2/3 large subunit